VAARSPRIATYADLEMLPEHLVGEIIGGELYTQARPRGTHGTASWVLGEELGPPFRRGRGGPGGWILLPEPELWLGPRPDVLVPDLAGWRRERLPTVDVAHFTTSPDWICELLSEGTRAHDRVRKVPLYARERVAHVWLVDPAEKTLEVLRLDGDGYRLVLAADGDDPVRAEPFDAIALELGLLWRA
jgi:Uma2 family endonuclease